MPRAAFGRDKARQLLAALLSARGPVHREIVLEWLWPELDVQRATRAFHVPLHALRRALEPDLPPRTPSSLVTLEGEAYRVVLTDQDHFDVAELLDRASTRRGEDPGDRIPQLERAAALRDEGRRLPRCVWRGRVQPRTATGIRAHYPACCRP